MELVPLPPEAEWSPVPAEVSSRGGSLVLSGEWRGIELEAVISSGETLSASLGVENLEGRSRVVEVGVFLPVNASGWRWWVDPRTSVEVSRLTGSSKEGQFKISYKAEDDNDDKLLYEVELDGQKVMVSKIGRATLANRKKAEEAATA